MTPGRVSEPVLAALWYYGLMPARKMTFSLDEETAEHITALGRELDKPKSAIVREAVAVYRKHSDRVSEAERRERVRIFREFLEKIPPADSHEAAEAELREIRLARRSGGRRTPVEP